MIAVIGSGPAGVSAARALVARGQRVAMFDAGFELEAERRAEIDTLAALAPDQWAPGTLEAISIAIAISPSDALAAPRLGFQLGQTVTTSAGLNRIDAVRLEDHML